MQGRRRRKARACRASAETNTPGPSAIGALEETQPWAQGPAAQLLFTEHLLCTRHTVGAAQMCSLSCGEVTDDLRGKVVPWAHEVGLAAHEWPPAAHLEQEAGPQPGGQAPRRELRGIRDRPGMCCHRPCPALALKVPLGTGSGSCCVGVLVRLAWRPWALRCSPGRPAVLLLQRPRYCRARRGAWVPPARLPEPGAVGSHKATGQHLSAPQHTQHAREDPPATAGGATQQPQGGVSSTLPGGHPLGHRGLSPRRQGGGIWSQA